MARLTRGPHKDGLTDGLDARSCGRQGEGFPTVLKDSRVGSFGVPGLVFPLLARIIGAASRLKAPGPAAWGMLGLAPIQGRAVLLIPAAPLSPRPLSTPGRLVAPG